LHQVGAFKGKQRKKEEKGKAKSHYQDKKNPSWIHRIIDLYHLANYIYRVFSTQKKKKINNNKQ